MTATSHVDVAKRLLANVEAGTSDQSPVQMKVPAASYRDPARWDAGDGADLPAFSTRRRPVVRLPGAGRRSTPSDRRAPDLIVVAVTTAWLRTFLNVCRHRGAPVAEGAATPGASPVHTTRGATTPRAGSSVCRAGTPSVTSTWPAWSSCTTHEREGVVLAVLTPDVDFDPVTGCRAWTRPSRCSASTSCTATRSSPSSRARTGSSPPTATSTATTSGTCTARRSARRPSPTATPTTSSVPTSASASPTSRSRQIRDSPERRVAAAAGRSMSMVHYVFPNISISGQPERPLMVSRLLPGPTPDRSTTVQYHYYRAAGGGRRGHRDGRGPAQAVRRRHRRGGLRHRVQDQPQRSTPSATTTFRFGRNERGNQNFHRWIARVVDDEKP